MLYDTTEINKYYVKVIDNGMFNFVWNDCYGVRKAYLAS